MEEPVPGWADDEERYADGLDTSVAHQARVYDYWLGGKDNISQEVRADFCDHARSFVIAGQTPLFEIWPISRSPTFMRLYVP
jgi:S-adenosyl methyltransferase